MSAPALKERLDRLIEHKDFGHLVEAVLVKNAFNVHVYTNRLILAGFEEAEVWMAIQELDRRRKREKLDESRFKL